ncbi:hypothetical protein [Endozoicomonas numazuensis]|uniref:Uncharacterized protein n=1 Tax=Endozoicomonas numazuensis TaxID=1137799 RepID=A0A081N1D0_9GAMM|nr:hypothetical protein [Endozoicomonas numazuensis]KEQ12253.1 hypothetical protein GZ78_27905 [Endozoicomonas numazuensis]
MMFDLIKYSSIQLRDIKEPATPKGPDFSLCGLVKHDLAGNILSFRSPKHCPKNSYSKAIYERRFKSMEFYTRLSNERVMPDQKWRHRTIFARTWAYCGPWFTGKLYQQTISINIIEPETVNNNISFFHPRAFESTILRLLTSSYSHNDESNQHIAPVDWKPLTWLPTPGAEFSITEPRGRPDSAKQVVILPFSDHHLLKISFSYGRNFWNETDLPDDELVSTLPLIKLRNSIIDSIHLELSPESQAQLDKATAECSGVKLTETFPPIDWSATKPNTEL